MKHWKNYTSNSFYINHKTNAAPSVHTFLHHIFTLLLSLTISAAAWGQRSQFLTMKNGLASSRISDVMQDRYGNVWIASECGLDHYDAARMRHYGEVSGDSLSLNSNFVQRLFEAKDGTLYVLTMKGLNIFNKENNQFHDVTFYSPTGDKVATTLTNSIIETKRYGILVSTSGWGIYKVDPEKRSASYIFDNLKTRFVNCLYNDKRQRIWISTRDRGTFCLLPNGKLISLGMQTMRAMGSSITCFTEDKNGNIYAGTDINGVWKYDEQLHSFRQIEYSNNNYPVRHLYYDNNRLLIGTEGHGLLQLLAGAKEITPVTDLWIPTQMDKSTPTKIMRGSKGNLWISFYKSGLGIFSDCNSPFLYYGALQHNRNFIGDSPASAVKQDNSGRTWIAVENDALYYIDANGITHGRIETSNGYLLNDIHSMHLDGTGNLWIGTGNCGLLKLNTLTGSVTRVGRNSDKTVWNTASFVSAIQDDAYGNLWIGTNGVGLYCMNIATEEIVACNSTRDAGLSKKSSNISNRWITSLCIGDNNELLIGTYYGLNRLKIRERIMSEFEQLHGEVVTAVAADDEKGLWVGTFHGIMMIKNGAEKVFNESNGIPNNVIQSLVADHEGNIWSGTNNGIVVLKKGNATPLVFKGTSDLGVNEFCAGSATVCNNGKVIFGGLTGISIISPKHLGELTRKPEVFISGVAYEEKYISYLTKSGSYTIVEKGEGASDPTTLHFAHDKATLAICLTNYDFTARDVTTYMFSINGEAWTKLPDGESNVVLNNLHPGTYDIRVKCITRNVESDEKQIRVVVHPAWWASIWAKIFYLLAFMGIVAHFVRHYRDKLLAAENERENKRQLEASESKLKFLIDLSHEIRTPMSMIISPVEKLIDTDGNNSNRRHYYDIIHNGSQRIMQLVNQMLDMSKVEQGKLRLTFRPTDINEYIGNICAFMEPMAEQNGIVLSCNSVLEDPTLWVDNDYFDKIIVNLIGNATKFTPEGGRISVTISDGTLNDKPAVYIAVADTGIGISDDDKKHIFDRFYQSKVQKSGNLGTGIGLNLTFALVELHNGTIEVMDNTDHQGTIFLIKLLRGNEHISPELIGPALEKKENTTAIPAPEASSNAPEKKKKNDHLSSSEKANVLIIDDDIDIRRFLEEELKDHYKVTTAGDGAEGWSLILKEKPDLVVTDIMMPVMDGIELCRKIRQNINVNSMPVIMLTAANTEDYQLKGLDTGADAYINKPFSLPVLTSTIRNVLQTRQMLRNCYEGRQESDVNISEIEDVPNHDEVLLQRIVKVIEENISNHDLNVEMLAKESALSRVHLYRKLKELTNQSPSDFIRQIRLKKAGELLHKGNYNISEVAHVMGFSSLAVFSRAFKDFYGVTPKEYVKK